jgi:outer membrane protein assembly factor BamD (BamD/ComL family)
MQESVPLYIFIRGAVLLLLIGGGGGWLIFRALKRSDDPSLLLSKWLATFFIIGVMLYLTRGNIGISDVLVGAVGGLMLTIIWRYSIASVFAKPFTALYDGGDLPADPRPFYSVAHAKRKRGHYNDAAAEVRKQLGRFPTDFEGQLLLAEIQAEDLNDLEAAALTISQICGQPDHAPRNIATALNTLADWHLKYRQDRDAAQHALEQVAAMYPGSEFALLAAQRIGHLATTEQMLEPHDRKPIHVPEGIKYVGLMQSSEHLAPQEADPVKLAAEYVQHLEQHPFDTEAREKLAIIYADHYQRLDLAADQLDQLIETPNQPARSVVHWLNLMADLQVRHNVDYETVYQTLQRIVDRYPNQPAADLARNRMELLKLELKVKEKNQPVKMGTYEQNIGLKQGTPRRP